MGFQVSSSTHFSLPMSSTSTIPSISTIPLAERRQDQLKYALPTISTSRARSRVPVTPAFGGLKSWLLGFVGSSPWQIAGVEVAETKLSLPKSDARRRALEGGKSPGRRRQIVAWEEKAWGRSRSCWTEVTCCVAGRSLKKRPIRENGYSLTDGVAGQREKAPRERNLPASWSWVGVRSVRRAGRGDWGFRSRGLGVFGPGWSACIGWRVNWVGALYLKPRPDSCAALDFHGAGVPPRDSWQRTESLSDARDEPTLRHPAAKPSSWCMGSPT